MTPHDKVSLSGDLVGLWRETAAELEAALRPSRAPDLTLVEVTRLFEDAGAQLPVSSYELTRSTGHDDPWAQQLDRLTRRNPYWQLYLAIQKSNAPFARFQRAVGLHMGLFAYVDPPTGRLRYLYGGSGDAHFFIKSYFEPGAAEWALDSPEAFRRAAAAFYSARTGSHAFRLDFAQILSEGLTHDDDLIATGPTWGDRLSVFERDRSMIYAHSGEIDACVLQWLLLHLDDATRDVLLGDPADDGIPRTWRTLRFEFVLSDRNCRWEPLDWGLGKELTFCEWLFNLGLIVVAGDDYALSDRGRSLLRWLDAYARSLASNQDITLWSDATPPVAAQALAPVLVRTAPREEMARAIDWETFRARMARWRGSVDTNTRRVAPENFFLEHVDELRRHEPGRGVASAILAFFDDAERLCQWTKLKGWVQRKWNKPTQDFLTTPQTRVPGWELWLARDVAAQFAAVSKRALSNTAGAYARWLGGCEAPPAGADLRTFAAWVRQLLAWHEPLSVTGGFEAAAVFATRCRFNLHSHLILRAGLRHGNVREDQPRAWMVFPVLYDSPVEAGRTDVREPVGFFLGTVRDIKSSADAQQFPLKLDLMRATMSALSEPESRLVYFKDVVRHREHIKSRLVFAEKMHSYKNLAGSLVDDARALQERYPDDPDVSALVRNAFINQERLAWAYFLYRGTPLAVHECQGGQRLAGLAEASKDWLSTTITTIWPTPTDADLQRIDVTLFGERLPLDRPMVLPLLSLTACYPLAAFEVLLDEIRENYFLHASHHDPASLTLTWEPHTSDWSIGRFVAVWRNQRDRQKRQTSSGVGLSALRDALRQHHAKGKNTSHTATGDLRFTLDPDGTFELVAAFPVSVTAEVGDALKHSVAR